jgi:hypothetical protein
MGTVLGRIEQQWTEVPVSRSWFDMWFADLITPRDGESGEQHLERIKESLTYPELDEDIE